TSYSVIIYGETGSGKESIAQEIHKRSKRSSKPFIAIDCGALSKELAASELFGHEKGSFTGALNQKIGSFELANGGTIFLDEVANLSYDVQVSLLRVVQERKMRRVGGTRDIDLDVRIIIASNELLWNATRSGKFREDLYHRFNEFSIEIPPLRERKEDIMLFANHFLKITNEELDKEVKGFDADVEKIFKEYVWYGNLRELKNVIKRATLLTEEGDYIEARTLPFEISNYSKLQFADQPAQVAFTPIQPVSLGSLEAKITGSGGKASLGENSLKEASIDAEYEMILQALKESNYNKSKAAQLLKIDRKTLYNKITLYEEMKNH
ncbi:MAG TPA: sigma-54 dependent transcriptional regulator, partial [Puia sp.]|nr:sigma-54 dependent transcriptional regulator [Puia sp.]